MAEKDGGRGRRMATVLKLKGVTLHSPLGFAFIRCHLSGALSPSPLPPPHRTAAIMV